MWPGRLQWVLNPQPLGEAGWARTVSADSPWSCLWPKTTAPRPAPSTTWPAAAYLLPGHGEGRVEPLLEGAAALEDGGQQEVEERPELGQLVLQRRARQQQAARRHVVRVEDLRQLAVVVLHAVAFVHNHVLPADLQAESRQSGEDGAGAVPWASRSLPLGTKAPGGTAHRGAEREHGSIRGGTSARGTDILQLCEARERTDTCTGRWLRTAVR